MAAHQAPLSLGFSRQEHWSGLPFPSPMQESEDESEVTQLCLTLRDHMDCSPPGSSVHGIFQARVLEWGAIAFFRFHGWGRAKTGGRATGHHSGWSAGAGRGHRPLRAESSSSLAFCTVLGARGLSVHVSEWRTVLVLWMGARESNIRDAGRKRG